MGVPFLFELRTSIDWTWTDTSMPLFDFFNMENFYATLYNLKCARTFEQVYISLHNAFIFPSSLCFSSLFLLKLLIN